MMEEERIDNVIETVPEKNEEEIRQENCLKKVGSQFGFFGLVSLVFGAFYTFCLYKNPSGITMPLFVAASYALAFLILKKMDIEVKREAYFLPGISVLIGIAACRTASEFFVFYNKLALLLLWLVFWIHQCYDDTCWNIGKYMSTIVIFFFHIIGLVGYPVKHGIAYVRSLKNNKYRNLVMVLLGVVFAIPLVAVLALLLSQADMVFEQMLTTFMTSFLRPRTLLSVTVMTLFGAAALYCLVCEISRKGIPGEVKDKRQYEPVIAITVMGLVGILYVMFCGVQIVYLFLGKGTLPEGVTYSGYARQGFFQLVFVAVFNLVMVLLSLKYFKKSGGLDVVLTVISVCTYVMIASAGFRMMMYIAEYHLTLLRVLVLWFLAVLSVLMAGVVVIIYRNKFPLFKYCLVVVSVCYLGLVWMKPELRIAEYNVSRLGIETEEADSDFREMEYDYVGLRYLTSLSADAAPVLVKLKGSSADQNGEIQRYLERVVNQEAGRTSWRMYNFSYGKVAKLQ